MDLNKMVGKKTHRLLPGKKTESYTSGCFPLSQDAIVITKCFFTLLLRLPKKYKPSLICHHPCWWFRNPANSPVEVDSLSHDFQALHLVGSRRSNKLWSCFTSPGFWMQVVYAQNLRLETSSVPGSKLPILVMVLPLIGIRRMGM